ncbi:MAG: hypothetical protein LCH96_18390 [Actinobacteria bacterium]|nr:hypothetical protein [Actinomycetota bacterium]
MNNAHISRTVAAGVLAAVSLVAPLHALPADAAEPLPCAAGTPVLGDYNGDGSPEALIQQTFGSSLRQWSVERDGLGTKVLTAFGEYGIETRNADLNGDRCSDVIVVASALTSIDVKLVLGSTSGLDAVSARSLTIPQAATLGGENEGRANAVGLRHDGVSQVIVGVRTTEQGTAIDVFTLDASGTPLGDPQVIRPEDVGSRGFGVEGGLDGSGGTFVVGAAADEVDGKVAGAVHVFGADSVDPTKMVPQARLTQDSPGVPDKAEDGDNFGQTVAFRDGWLAVGVPYENIGSTTSAGLVQPFHWDAATHTYTAYRAIQQNAPGVPGSNQRNENFGERVMVTRGLTAKGSHDIVVSWNDRDLAGYNAPGRVLVANATRSIYRAYTELTPGVPGSTLDYDFGSSLGYLATSTTTDTLLIGSPYESVDDCDYSGRVLRSDGGRLTNATRWRDVPSPGCEVQFWGQTIGR